MAGKPLEQRVIQTCESVLAAKKFVSAIDVLVGLGWLAPSHVDQWRQGRVPVLEWSVQAGLGKVATAMKEFRRWSQGRDLIPSETAYIARSRDRRHLQFSVSGDPEIERFYRTHWVSPELSKPRRDTLAEKQNRPPDLVVVSAVHDWTCAGCTGTGDFLLMLDDNPVCLRCAKLDHLVFLESGDAGITRRARKASDLTAVVVRFSRTRKRYERQCVMVEPAALATAKAEKSTAGPKSIDGQ